MKSRDLLKLGVPPGELLDLAKSTLRQAAKAGLKKGPLKRAIKQVVAHPESSHDDPHFGDLARALSDAFDTAGQQPLLYVERQEPAPWRRWGDDIDNHTIRQMDNACRLPVAVSGALMADAHLGYGLPIGGVLATDNAVVPYAVGVDIACRMRLSVFDMPASEISGSKQKLANAIEKETRFGIGACFQSPRDHNVMDEDWGVSPITRDNKQRAWTQLGSSGSGNHFVEFGVFTLDAPAADLNLDPGSYVALLSHSGSRGPGAKVAQHYSRLAERMHPELPKSLRQLAWLALDTPQGQEYWAAMQLMGKFAAANHEVIHRELTRHLKTKVLATVENHHNFAWKEEHDGRQVVVHRKGATPAGRGSLGIIPGSMASPGYVVRGLGKDESLRSASHGAGRVMSRKKAKVSFTWSDAKRILAEKDVTLLSAGIDEVPGVYRNIDDVMAAQTDLVETVGRFDPRIVKMAPEVEQPQR